MGKALVLGGGGVAGIAWMTGLARGLAEGGVEVRDTDRIVGTSAGAAVAAQLTSTLPMDELYQGQTDPALQAFELKPKMDGWTMALHALPSLINLGHPQRRAKAVGRMARAVRTVPPAERLAVIDERLPRKQWPDRDMGLIAVDTDNGEMVQFTKHSGVSLRDAVAASCAVPSVWPPVEIKGRFYMDGGVRSSDNADLAAGSETVLIVSPLGGVGLARKTLMSQIEGLKAGGSDVRLIEPDAGARNALGKNPLAPESRLPSAEAGLTQGRALAPELAGFWR